MAVEAELGELACGAAGRIDDHGQLTDPVAGRTIRRGNGVDLLASAWATFTFTSAAKSTSTWIVWRPFTGACVCRSVLHGGTGITADSLQQAMRLGVAKVNYGTYLKQRYLQAVRTCRCGPLGPLRKHPATRTNSWAWEGRRT